MSVYGGFEPTPFPSSHIIGVEGTFPLEFPAFTQPLVAIGEEARMAVMHASTDTPVSSTIPIEGAVPDGVGKEKEVKHNIVTRYLIQAFKAIANALSRWRDDPNIEIAANRLLLRPDIDLPKDQKLQKAIQNAIKVAAKKLNKNESAEIEIPGLKGRKIVILKEHSGKIDVLVHEAILGQGTFGIAYKAISAITSQERALKYTISGRDDAANASAVRDLEKEIQNLQLLNRKGPLEGIQGMVQITSLKEGGKLKGQKISTGNIYSHKDLQNEVNFLRIAKAIGIPIHELKKLSEMDIKKQVKEALDGFKENISNLVAIGKELEERRGKIIAKIKEQPSNKELLKERDNIIQAIGANKNKIQAEFEIYSDLIEEYSDTEQIKNDFKQNLKPLVYMLQRNTFEGDLGKEIDKLLANPLEAIVKKAQAFPGVDQRKRMGLAANLMVGMKHMHQNGIIHGDIKPKNFFWDGLKAVIGDFGGAKQKKQPLELPSVTAQYSSVGANEALKHYAKVGDEENWFRAGQAADMRAMGISMYEIFTGGASPSENSPEYYDKKTYEKMKQNMIDSGMSEEIAQIISNMCIPVKFDSKSPPTNYPLPVEPAEVDKLIRLLQA